MSKGDIDTIPDAAAAAAPVFEKQGWTYGAEPADAERIEETIRRLVFNPAFKDEETTSISSGRFLVTRADHLYSEDPNSRSIYLHLADI